MSKIFIFLLLVIGYNLNASENITNKADCIILKEENSIICKYIHKRVNKITKVKFEWIEPDGKISRTRDMIIPSGHGSIYDYRYIKGRTKGEWTFKIIDNNQTITTNFTIE
jgi:hypothetical protein